MLGMCQAIKRSINFVTDIIMKYCGYLLRVETIITTSLMELIWRYLLYTVGHKNVPVYI